MIGAQSSSRPATGAPSAQQHQLQHLSQQGPPIISREPVPRGVGIGVAIAGSDVTPDPTPNASPQRNNGRVRAGSNAEMTRDASIWTRGKAIPAGITVEVPAGMGTGMGKSRYRSNGHGGTHFTVGNVSNGMLYLRPVIRSNAELRQNFILSPSTPPSSAEEADARTTHLPYQSSPPRTPTHIPPLFQSTTTGTSTASQPSAPIRRHGRSRSHTLGASISSILPPTQVQIQIEAPPESDVGMDQLDGPARPRPRTSAAEDNFDALDVHIPRYNLGSPRFSPGGTPFLYAQFGSNSSFLPSVSGEFGSSTSASRQPSPGGGKGQWIFPATTAAAVAGVSALSDSRTESPPLSMGGMIHREITASIMSTIAPAQPLSIPGSSPSPGLAPSPIPPPMERTASAMSSILPPIPSPPVPPRFGPLKIDPSIWDPLATAEGMDNPEIVLYHTIPSASNIPGAILNREIRAATPLRIVAQITSPDFVDYHLLSDFFLTYRLFMNSSSLAEMLFSRLKWALARGQDQDEARQMQGKVVRVRAFVAIRHWILNYFADDFVPFLQFRREFVRALNDLTFDILKREGKQKATSSTSPPSAEVRILAELKRCWRRTCALYWDSTDAINTPDKLDNFAPEVPITPGGPPGTREDAVRHSVASLRKAGKLPPGSPPPQLGSLLSGNGGSEDSFLQDVVNPVQPSESKKGKEATVKSSKSPATSLGRKSGAAIAAALRKASMKDKEEKTKSDPGSIFSAAIRSPPSTSSSVSTSASSRVGGHKRSGSFSDALRDERAPLPLQTTTASQSIFSAGMPYAGSLARGNQFGPIPATVGGFIAPPSSAGDYTPYGTITTISTMANGKETNPGMRRLIGTVKKAFGGNSSTQTTQGRKRKGSVAKSEKSVSSTSSKRHTHHNSGSLGSTAGTFATTSVFSGVRDDGTIRIDVLGAKAMENFLKAMERIQAEEADGESSSILTDKTDSRNRDSSTTDLTSRLSSTVNKPSTGGFVMSGALPGMMDGSQETRGKGTEGFLDSPSTMPGTPAEQTGDGNDYLGVETFLADRSTEYSVSERGSYMGDEIPPMPMIPLHLRKQVSAEKEREESDVGMEMTPPGTAEEEDQEDYELESQLPAPSIRTTSHLRVSPDADTISIAPSAISVAPSALSEAPPEAPEPPTDHGAGRGLRRRPGGNLRGVNNVNDLEPQPRAHSVGSIGTGTYTIDSFGASRVLFQRPFSPASRSTVSDAAHLDLATLSVGATGGRGFRGSVMGHHGGLLPPWDHRTRTPDCQPTEEEKLATFSEGVQLLRDIPDDSSDDGGFEVAMQKLNGTYKRKTSVAEMSPKMQQFRISFAETLRRSGAGSLPMEDLGLGLEHVQTLPVIDDAASGLVDQEDEEEGPIKRWEERQSNRARHRHKQVVDHIPLETPPLMDGPTSFMGASIASTSSSSLESSAIAGRNSGDTRSSNVLPSNSGSHSHATSTPNLRSAPTSEDLRAVDDELNRLAKYRSERRKTDFESSMGSSSNSTFPPVNSGTIISELSGPLGSHPLRHPPSPPLTLEQALSLSPGRSTMPSTRGGRARNGTFTTTTGTLPTIATTAGGDAEEREMESELTTSPQLLEPTPTHLPFILAYDSELLARQFTLIEKDALQEVDWKELVELSWGRAVTAEVRDWVDVLNLKVIKGVELAILRFNLMTRWTTSTLLLTLSPHERARTISKLIHIAAHSRRIHNFATMYQITIALLTTPVARLKYTWTLVPEADKRMLRDMERLLQPVGNFAALRREVEVAEAEVGGGGGDGAIGEEGGVGVGVVPFVGLFTHDLIKNAQRPLLIPAVIPSSPSRPPPPGTPSFPSSSSGAGTHTTATATTKEERPMLVNFERHRATAGIVKRLLKMVEAGRGYGIEPVDGVCERCLWVGALGERELEGLSLGIERREGEMGVEVGG